MHPQILIDMIEDLKKMTGKTDYEDLAGFIAETTQKITENERELFEAYVKNTVLFDQTIHKLQEALKIYLPLVLSYAEGNPSIAQSISKTLQILEKVLDENRGTRNAPSLSELGEIIEILDNTVQAEVKILEKDRGFLKELAKSITQLIKIAEDTGSRINAIIDKIVEKYGSESALAFEVGVSTIILKAQG